MKTLIYLVRHCEAEGNHHRVFHGVSDSRITPGGQAQLERLAERFRTVELDAVYASPLLRARLTAEAVNRHHGLPVTLRPDLREIDGGRWEGKPWADFPTLYPEEAHDWNLAPWDFAPVGGETMRQVWARVTAALWAVTAEQAGRRVAVVSHGCAIRNLLCYAHGWPITRLNEVDWGDNTCVSLLEIEGTVPEQTAVRVVFENDNSHLDADQSTLGKQNWWKKENRDSLRFD